MCLGDSESPAVCLATAESDVLMLAFCDLVYLNCIYVVFFFLSFFGIPKNPIPPSLSPLNPQFSDTYQ